MEPYPCKLFSFSLLSPLFPFPVLILYHFLFSCYYFHPIVWLIFFSLVKFISGHIPIKEVLLYQLLKRFPPALTLLFLLPSNDLPFSHDSSHDLSSPTEFATPAATPQASLYCT